MKEKRSLKIKKFFVTTWAITRKTFFRFVDNQGLLIANGLAFKTIIALVPVLIIIAGVFRVFPYFSVLKDNLLDLLRDFFVPSSFAIVVSWIDKVLDKTGTISLISIFIFIYLSLDLLITLDNQVERIWSSKFKRSIIQKVLKYWALLTATPFVLGGYFHYSGFIRSFISLTPLSNISNFEEIIYTGVSFILLTLFFFLLYYIIPNAKIHYLKAIIISFIVSVVWILMRFAFTYYTALLVGRWSIFYGSFAAILFFIIWTSINWIVVLFGVEFLCVWQNKLYLGHIRFKKLFLFDVGFLLLLLQEFDANFKNTGNGLTTKDLAGNFKYDHDDILEIIKIFEDEGFIVGDSSPEQQFFLRKDISKIKLSDIESLVWKRLSIVDYKSTPRLQEICEALGQYYFKHKDNKVIYLNKILMK